MIMPRIIARDISITFPLHRKSQAPGFADTVVDRDHFVFDASGRLRGVRALNGLNFEFNTGDRVGVIGRNGSGKTTLLQILAGIFPPDSGELSVEGRATNLININLGMQPEASGHRNITLRGLAAGETRDAIEARREEIVSFAELGEFMDMPIETYSAGMRMRLSFAIATAFEPEILILDEWLSTGDIAFREKATARMNSFVGKAGILILASHSRKLMIDNCDRGIWLSHGRIEMDGPMAEVLDAYEEAAKKPSP